MSVAESGRLRPSLTRINASGNGDDFPEKSFSAG